VNEALRALFFAIVTITAFWNVTPGSFIGYEERFEMNCLRQYLSAALKGSKPDLPHHNHLLLWQ
jgi:hypothetical protein